MSDLDEFIDGLTSIDRDNLRNLLASVLSHLPDLPQEGAPAYVARLFTGLYEGVIAESERRAFAMIAEQLDEPR